MKILTYILIVIFCSCVVFCEISDDDYEDEQSEVTCSKNIAIIGGGLMGSAVAYFLKENMPGSNFCVDVYDKGVQGSRRRHVKIGEKEHDLALDVELAASLFSPNDILVNELVQRFGLQTDPLSFENTNLSFWNGDKFVNKFRMDKKFACLKKLVKKYHLKTIIKFLFQLHKIQFSYFKLNSKLKNDVSYVFNSVKMLAKELADESLTEQTLFEHLTSLRSNSYMEKFITEVLDPLIMHQSAGQTAASMNALSGYLCLLKSPFWLNLTSSKHIYSLTEGSDILVNSFQKSFSATRNFSIVHGMEIEKIVTENARSLSSSDSPPKYKIISTGLKRPRVESYDCIILSTALNQVPHFIQPRGKISNHLVGYQPLTVTFLKAGHIKKSFFKGKHRSSLLQAIMEKQKILSSLQKSDTVPFMEYFLKEHSPSKRNFVYSTCPSLPFISIEVIALEAKNEPTYLTSRKYIYKVYSRKPLEYDLLMKMFEDLDESFTKVEELKTSYPTFPYNFSGLKEENLLVEPAPQVYASSTVEILNLSMELQLLSAFNVAKKIKLHLQG